MVESYQPREDLPEVIFHSQAVPAIVAERERRSQGASAQFVLPEDLISILEELPNRRAVSQVVLQYPEPVPQLEARGSAIAVHADRPNPRSELISGWAKSALLVENYWNYLYTWADELEGEKFNPFPDMDVTRKPAAHLSALLCESDDDAVQFAYKTPLRSLVLLELLGSQMGRTLSEERSSRYADFKARCEKIISEIRPLAPELLVSAAVLGDSEARSQTAAKLATVFGDAELIKRIPKLYSLDLGYHPLADGHLARLEGATELRRLNLNAVAINGSCLEALAKLPNLEELSLSRTNPRPTALKALKQFPALKRLDLTGVPVDDGTLQWLKDMRGLEQLDLTRTRVTPRGLETLNEALPGCAVVPGT